MLVPPGGPCVGEQGGTFLGVVRAVIGQAGRRGLRDMRFRSVFARLANISSIYGYRVAFIIHGPLVLSSLINMLWRVFFSSRACVSSSRLVGRLGSSFSCSVLVVRFLPRPPCRFSSHLLIRSVAVFLTHFVPPVAPVCLAALSRRGRRVRSKQGGSGACFFSSSVNWRARAVCSRHIGVRRPGHRFMPWLLPVIVSSPPRVPSRP